MAEQAAAAPSYEPVEPRTERLLLRAYTRVDTRSYGLLRQEWKRRQ